MVATPKSFLNPFSFSVRLPVAIPVATHIYIFVKLQYAFHYYIMIFEEERRNKLLIYIFCRWKRKGLWLNEVIVWWLFLQVLLI